jgi:alpha-beta hydrolase superfamily lysophospholipase
MTATTLSPPPRRLAWLEGRAILELGAAVAAWPRLATAPRGDGHAVIVLPGLLATDGSTRPLRRFLRGRGYEVHGWGEGRNRGLRDGVQDRLMELLQRLRRRSGRPVSLVGWSLGGLFARELAHAEPSAVRGVVTLGTPLCGHARATRAWRVYEWASGSKVDDPNLPRPTPGRPAVPCTSIWSRSDGIVSWRCSREPVRVAGAERAENIVVEGSHCGLGFNPAVLYAVADRLAQPEGRWAPFHREGWRRFLYPDPGHTP